MNKLPVITCSDKSVIERKILGISESLGFKIIVIDHPLTDIYSDYNNISKSSGIIYYGVDDISKLRSDNILWNPGRSYHITSWYEFGIKTIHFYIEKISRDDMIIDVVKNGLKSIKRRILQANIPVCDLTEIFPHIRGTKLDENDIKALLSLILGRDMSLTKHKPRLMIDVLKNDPEYLEKYLQYLKDMNGGEYYDPGAGRYFFTDVKDNRTFDIYKKYQIKPEKLTPECVTKQQWQYLCEIGYVTVSVYISTRNSVC